MLDLADKYGYRVILTLGDQVLIAQANQGSYLPDFQYLSGATTVDPPNTPSAIVVAAGHTVVQYDFKLVAVALETDNTIVPLNKVSYRPQTVNGWADSVSDLAEFSKINDSVARTCALKSVFRYYQIAPPFEMPELDPLNPQNDNVDDIMQVLPLMDVQLVRAPKQLQPADEDDELSTSEPGQPIPAWVYGVYEGSHDDTNNTTPTVDSSISEPDLKKGWYRYEFQIDAERGLVIFSEHVYRFSDPNQPPGQRMIAPAQLYLRTTCNVRDAETYGFLQNERRTDLPTAGVTTKPRYVKSDDIARKIRYVFTGAGQVAGSTDNKQEVAVHSDYVIAATLAKMTVNDPQSFEYPGFVFIGLDGAIQQITWNVGDDGRATTQCNRGKEDLVNSQSYEESKKSALLQAAIAKGGGLTRIRKQETSQSLTVSGI